MIKTTPCADLGIVFGQLLKKETGMGVMLLLPRAQFAKSMLRRVLGHLRCFGCASCAQALTSMSDGRRCQPHQQLLPGTVLG